MIVYGIFHNLKMSLYGTTIIIMSFFAYSEGKAHKGDRSMSQFLKDMIMRKLKELSEAELLHYAKQYGFSITQDEVRQIIHYLRHHPVDPFHAAGRLELLKALSQITNLETAKQAQALFTKMIQAYGLEHLFD